MSNTMKSILTSALVNFMHTWNYRDNKQHYHDRGISLTAQSNLQPMHGIANNNYVHKTIYKYRPYGSLSESHIKVQ